MKLIEERSFSMADSCSDMLSMLLSMTQKRSCSERSLYFVISLCCTVRFTVVKLFHHMYCVVLQFVDSLSIIANLISAQCRAFVWALVQPPS